MPNALPPRLPREQEGTTSKVGSRRPGGALRCLGQLLALAVVLAVIAGLVTSAAAEAASVKQRASAERPGKAKPPKRTTKRRHDRRGPQVSARLAYPISLNSQWFEPWSCGNYYRKYFPNYSTWGYARRCNRRGFAGEWPSHTEYELDYWTSGGYWREYHMWGVPSGLEGAAWLIYHRPRFPSN